MWVWFKAGGACRAQPTFAAQTDNGHRELNFFWNPVSFLSVQTFYNLHRFHLPPPPFSNGLYKLSRRFRNPRRRLPWPRPIPLLLFPSSLRFHPYISRFLFPSVWLPRIFGKVNRIICIRSMVFSWFCGSWSACRCFLCNQMDSFSSFFFLFLFLNTESEYLELELEFVCRDLVFGCFEFQLPTREL